MGIYKYTHMVDILHKHGIHVYTYTVREYVDCAREREAERERHTHINVKYPIHDYIIIIIYHNVYCVFIY